MQVLVLLAAVATGISARPSHSDPFLDAMLAAEYPRSKRWIPPFHENMKRICFDHKIGCFEWSEVSFTGAIPQDPGMTYFNTTFNLYSRAGADVPPIAMLYEEETSYNNISALRNTEKPLFVVAHGFGESGRIPWMLDMKDILIRDMDANVILVDWKLGCSLPFYSQAVANTFTVSRAIAYMLAQITHTYGYSPKAITFIGFSLGAQVGGFAGRHFRKLTGHKFGKLIALDAAAPQFEKNGVHITKDDSDFTVGIHTSAGKSIITGKLGMVKPIGHVDFYPNGGVTQPGCKFFEVRCHHQRAYRYFLEAIINDTDPQGCKFIGEKCKEDWKAVMDNRCTPTKFEGIMSLTPMAKGKLHLKTHDASPFCIPIQHDNRFFAGLDNSMF